VVERRGTICAVVVSARGAHDQEAGFNRADDSQRWVSSAIGDRLGVRGQPVWRGHGGGHPERVPQLPVPPRNCAMGRA